MIVSITRAAAAANAFTGVAANAGCLVGQVATNKVAVCASPRASGCIPHRGITRLDAFACCNLRAPTRRLRTGLHEMGDA